MVVIKDPDWYLTNQDTVDKIYSNSIFLVIGLYHLYKKKNLLGALFIFLAIGSTAFHVKTNRETLFIDRLAMILVFSYFFNMFYPAITILNYSLMGFLAIGFWYKTEELLFYFLFQLVGLLLFLFFYPMNFYYKLLITVSYIGITYSQVLEKGKYHSLKHIALGLLSLIF